MKTFAFLLCAALAAAQQPPQTARIEGRVVTQKGEAVPRATVNLVGPVRPSVPAVSTDNEGRFVFADLTPGRYAQLSAQKAGFATQTYGARTPMSPGTPLNLIAGAEVKDIVIRLTQQGVITGHITDQDGDPLAGARVFTLRTTYTRGRRILSLFTPATADDRGDFRIANLPPGRYYVEAQGRPVTTTSQSRAPFQEVDAITYYPDVLEEANAKPLDVPEGGEIRGIDIRVRKGRMYSIRGTIVDQSTGLPPGGLPMSISKRNPDGGSTLRTVLSANTDGSFAFQNLPAGTYLIQAMPGSIRRPDGQPTPSPYTGRKEVTITDASLDNFVLPLTLGYEIDGTVRLEGGDLKSLLPAPSGAAAGSVVLTTDGGAIALLGSNTARVTVTLGESNGGPSSAATISSGGSASAATIKEDGSLRFSGLAASEYVLSVNGTPEGTYLKSVKFGDRDVTHAPLDTASGSGKLEIVLSSKAADLSGTSKGGIVTLWPKTPNPGSATGGVKQVYADQNGAFKFSSLAPGEYYVAAWDELDPGLWQTDEFVRRFNQDASLITLDESAHATLDPKLIPHEKFTAEMDKLP